VDLVLGQRTLLMGVVNVTPDSFSDGGLFFDAGAAIARGQQLVRDGADVLDVGGESTRPGAAPVGERDELARVLPVVRGLRGAAVISVDTSKPAVAAAAIEAGASFVNDVTGLREGDELARVAARGGAWFCVMHSKGPPAAMKRDPGRGDEVEYADLFGEIVESLRASVERAVAAGMPRHRVFVDPGIGFGKTYAHNLSLLKGLGRLRALGQPVLVGTSRKGFLGQLTGRPPLERDVATAATVAITSAMGTADVVRVHSVREARDAALVGDAVFRAL
jgi:dihydropteroate synthase